MTHEQRDLVRYWTVSCCFLVAIGCISFLDAEYEQIAILGLMGMFWVVSLFMDFSRYYSGFDEGREKLRALMEKHPALKLWLVICCGTLLPFFIYRMQTDQEIAGTLYWLSFVLLLGPVIVVSELERFRSMGEPNA